MRALLLLLVASVALAQDRPPASEIITDHFAHSDRIVTDRQRLAEIEKKLDQISETLRVIAPVPVVPPSGAIVVKLPGGYRILTLAEANELLVGLANAINEAAAHRR